MTDAAPKREIVDVPADGVPESPVATGIQVVAGGPCSGKTTLLRALAEAGHHVEYEGAETLLSRVIAKGRTAEDVRRDPAAWQRRVVEFDFDLFRGLPRGELVFTDTSLVETVVFTRASGMAIGPNLTRFMRNLRYANVFFLEPLARYESTAVRMEDEATSRALGEAIVEAYREFGYAPVRVPPVSPEARATEILAAVG